MHESAVARAKDGDGDVMFWRQNDGILLLVGNGGVDEAASFAEEAVGTDKRIVRTKKFGLRGHLTSGHGCGYLAAAALLDLGGKVTHLHLLHQKFLRLLDIVHIHLVWMGKSLTVISRSRPCARLPLAGAADDNGDPTTFLVPQ